MTWDNNKNTFDSRPSVPSDEKLTAAEWNNHVSDQKGRVPFGPLADRPSAANASNGDVWFVTDLANDAGIMTKLVSGSWEIMGLGDASNKLPDVFAETVTTEQAVFSESALVEIPQSISNTTQVENMSWQTVSRQLDFLPRLDTRERPNSLTHYRTQFNNELFGFKSNHFNRFAAPSAVPPTIDNGTMTVSNSSGSDAGELFAPWTKLPAPVATVAVRVKDHPTPGSAAYTKVGLIKDSQNRITIQANRASAIQFYTEFNNTGTSTNLSTNRPNAPFWLVAMFAGNRVRAFTVKDGGWTHHGKGTWSSVDLYSESELSEWYPHFGYFMPDGETVEFDDFQIFNSARFGVLSPMPVHYKDGAPFIQDGELYLTGAVGAGSDLEELYHAVYAMDLDTYDLRMTGALFNQPEGFQDEIINDQGVNLVYDQDTGEWIVTFAGFANAVVNNKTHEIYVTRTTEDPRFGVNSYKTDAMNLPGTDEHEDHWLIYDRDAAAWRCYYMSNRSPRTSTLAETTDDGLTSGWSTISSRSISSGVMEGNQISRVAGEYIVSNTDDSQPNGYATADYPQVDQNINSPSVDQGSGFGDPHFRVIPIPDGDETRYIAITMGGERAFGLGRWSSGSLLVYEADERATGYEYPVRRFV